MACVFHDTILELAQISAYSFEKSWYFDNSSFNDHYDHKNMIGVAEILAHSIEKAEIPITPPPVMACVLKETILEWVQISAYSIERSWNLVTPPLMTTLII